MRAPRSLLVLLLAAFAGALAPACGKPEARSPVAAIAMLHSADPSARLRGADELAVSPGPPAEAVPALYAALRREQDPKVYGALLVALGASGISEVRPLIDARVNDPDGDTQQIAREALKRWLVRNMLLGEGDALPPPPHRLYGPPGALPPGAPGAQATPGLEAAAGGP